MRRINVQGLLCLPIILLGLLYPAQIFASQCPRRCLVKVFADEQYNKGLNEVVSSFLEAAQTDHFVFVYWENSEYLLSVEYHVFENDIYRSGAETDEQGKSRIVRKGPFRSHLIFSLWFVAGKAQDNGPGSRGFDHEFNYFIRDWESWSGYPDTLSHKDAILSQIQATPPLHEIAWDYERMPETIEMEPEKECVEYDEEVRINMKSSKDRKGRNAQPFYRSGCDNRFVFTTEHGKILLSDENKIGEKEWAASADYNYYMYQAPSADECRDCKEDTITVYNSCDVLDPDVYPYSQTRKNEKIYEITIDIGCDWEGTIESTGKIAEKGVGKGGESLLAIALVEGEAQSEVTWKLDVVFKLDRGNDRAKIYELKSANFSFLDTTEGETRWETPEGKVRGGGSWLAKVENRNLSPSECDLELIFDLKKKTYKIEGVLHVKNIAEKVEGEFELDVPPIHGGEKDSGGQQIDYREEILIEGKFSEDNPDTLEGNLEMKDEIPPEFMEFMEAFVGNIAGTTRWKLEKKGK